LVQILVLLISLLTNLLVQLFKTPSGHTPGFLNGNVWGFALDITTALKASTPAVNDPRLAKSMECEPIIGTWGNSQEQRAWWVVRGA